jgi:hypothetical protein
MNESPHPTWKSLSADLGVVIRMSKPAILRTLARLVVILAVGPMIATLSEAFLRSQGCLPPQSSIWLMLVAETTLWAVVPVGILLALVFIFLPNV